jgi:hypothetical protein
MDQEGTSLYILFTNVINNENTSRQILKKKKKNNNFLLLRCRLPVTKWANKMIPLFVRISLIWIAGINGQDKTLHYINPLYSHDLKE